MQKQSKKVNVHKTDQPTKKLIFNMMYMKVTNENYTNLELNFLNRHNKSTALTNPLKVIRK